MRKLHILTLILFFFSCSSQDMPSEDSQEIDIEPGIAPRDEMRKLVQEISDYGKMRHPGFIVIPQNGEELISLTEEPDGPPAESYLDAVDGFGREELFFGYSRDDAPTPERYRLRMLSYLNNARSLGKTVLVTDYCSSAGNRKESAAGNSEADFLSFQAHRRELDEIPEIPLQTLNPAPVTNLNEAADFLYLINPGQFESREGLISALAETFYDVLIIDAFFDTFDPLTAEDISRLQQKPNGSRRLVIAYFSIGEAESYRYYWQNVWLENRPDWLKGKNSHWAGNYTVEYWQEDWKKILYGQEGAYLDRILDAGFDGVYLDIVDGYERFE